MTERWRKRLRDLDAEGPSERVFERAKEGPTIPDSALPRPGAGTRVATGVAAFLVFGLAISVFAIPILRMSDPTRSAGQMGLQPLWPYSSLEEAVADQERIDASGADDPALHPDAVVERFAHDVMGWDEFAWVSRPDNPPMDTCSIVGISEFATLPPTPFAGPTSSPCDPTGYWDGSSASSAPPMADIAFEIARTEGAITRPDPTQVVVYQPLRRGSDGVWAVQWVKTSFLDISTRPGDILSTGDSVMAVGPFDVPGSLHLVAHGPCPSHEAVSLEGSIQGPGDGRLWDSVLEVVLEEECQGAAPGRAFALSVQSSGTASLDIDPFEGAGPPLLGLVAAPVIVDFDSPVPSDVRTTDPAPPSGVLVSPTPSSLQGSTYIDERDGWSAQVPDGWTVYPFQHQDRVSSWGAFFASGEALPTPGDGPPMQQVFPDPGGVIVFVWGEEGGPASLPADDVWPPPALSELDVGPSGLSGNFRANGRSYSILVKVGGNDVTGVQELEIESLLASISFPGWEPGDERGGYTAIWPADEPVTWVNLRGGIYIQFSSDPARLFGPVLTCGEGQNMTSDEEGNAILECPDGTSSGYFPDGANFKTNPQPNAQQLDAHPVIRAWDGTALANLNWTL